MLTAKGVPPEKSPLSVKQMFLLREIRPECNVHSHMGWFPQVFFVCVWFFCVCVQDSVFRLEPHVENGRGKSPYDPKLLTASMLIGESKPDTLRHRRRALLFHCNRYEGCNVNLITEQEDCWYSLYVDLLCI